MKEFLAVASGGAFGAAARYGVVVLSTHYLGSGFPYGTVIVNVVGSFIMGVFIELSALVLSVSASTRLFLVVGFLGAFTTFSTFSLDFAHLYNRGKIALGGMYVLTSVILSIGALFVGLYVVRRFLPPPT